jgi:FAD/FMN-containing dehydrogenase
MGPLPDGHIKAAAFQFGGRLIPRDVVENDTDSFNKVIRDLTSKGVICVGSSVTFKAYPGASNAVHPAWRKAIMSMQIGTLWDGTRWDDMLADQKRITNEFMPQLEAITPGSGTYMNEADFNQPNWKEVFYSTNWDRLLAAKKKWDPKSLFYNHMGVGSDVWTVVEDGCMCKA